MRVFKSETDAEQTGSGFVIDGDQGLIFSAGHVVSGLNGMAWIAFPRDSVRYPAKVLIPKRGGSLKPDLSVLQLDPALKGLHAMEVQFDAIHEEEEHRITGLVVRIRNRCLEKLSLARQTNANTLCATRLCMGIAVPRSLTPGPCGRDSCHRR